MKKIVEAGDGTRLNVELSGDAGKPRLMLSNSLGTNIGMWQPQVDALSEHYQIARYDTRGHGASDAPAGDYTIDLLGNDALAIADALQWDAFNFAGVSLGAMTGFWLAINAPKRVRKVVAANGGPMAGGPDVWIERIKVARSDGLASFSESVATRWFTPAFLSASPETVNEIKTAFLATSAEGYAGCCAALRDLDLRAGLAGIEVPMLIMGGEHDVTPPPNVLKMAADKVPGSQFKVLPAAHLSNVEASAEFNKALHQFM